MRSNDYIDNFIKVNYAFLLFDCFLTFGYHVGITGGEKHMRKFTPEQQSAICAKGADILVSAAAGSGKTAVLVERIIHTITDKVKPADIDKLIVVTFTEQAAAEMRLRINKRLNEMLKASPQDFNLKKQAALTVNANIMTIHAFCRKIVREHAYLLDLDPNFKIGEPAEFLIIKQELMEDLLEDEYSKENNQGFTELVEMYGSKYNDDSLRELIFEIHEFMFSSPWPFKRIDEYTQLYEPENLRTFDKTAWASLFADAAKTRLESARFELECARKICLDTDGPEKYISSLDQDITDIDILAERLNGGLEAAWAYFRDFEFSVKRLPPYKKTEPVSDILKEAAQKTRSSAKAAVKKLIKSCFERPLSEYLLHLERLYPIIKNLSALAVKFANAYQTEKLDKNMLDFNDLEQYALKVLYTEESDMSNLRLSEAAYEIKTSFEEILIDEYQDSNQIQELILKAVSSDMPKNRFMVGDIKQSIYRFRQAEPSIFIEKYNRYALYNQQPNAAKIRIDLQKNFRSRKNIISIINFLFYQLMSRDLGGIDYDDNAALYYGANYPEHICENQDTGRTAAAEHPVEIILLETDADNAYVLPSNNADYDQTAETENTDSENSLEDLTKAEYEAGFIAEKISVLVNGENKQYVYDTALSGFRPAMFRDIVILSASVKNIADTFTEVFEKRGIPLYVNTSGGYFKSLEVLTVLSLLHIIDNPKQDIHMVSVLHSPIYGVTCDELVEIRAIREKSCFYDCLLDYSATRENTPLTEKINIFLSQLYEFRQLALFTPISELLWVIYKKTGYFEYAGAMRKGQLRKANLRALTERAVTYEDTRFKGLFHFLKYVEKLILSKNDLPEAKIISENENVVRLMTIHASKGLEFPIVFAASMDRLFNMSALRKSILLDTDCGFGPQFIDLEYRIRYNTISRIALTHKTLNEELSEKLRLLYTALTRAKEKLILTGVIGSYDKKREKWLSGADETAEKLPKHFMLKAGCFLDWIMPALLRRERLSGLKYSDCIFTINAKSAAQYAREETTAANRANAQAAPKTSYANADVPQSFSIDDMSQDASYPFSVSDMSQDASYPFSVGDTSQDAPHPFSVGDMSQKKPSDLSGQISDNTFAALAAFTRDKLNWEYPYKAASKLPSKISISELKRLNYNEISGTDSAPYYESELIFAKPLFLSGRENKKTDIGTAIHTIMEHIDFKHEYNEYGIKELIHELTEKKLIRADVAEKIPVWKIARFLNSELCGRIRNSPRIMREVPFVTVIKPNALYPDIKNSDENILLHGIIDLYFEEKDGLVLLDYKSDRIPETGTELILQKYTPQLAVYKKAISETESLPVKEVYLYLFSNDTPLLCEISD